MIICPLHHVHLMDCYHKTCFKILFEKSTDHINHDKMLQVHQLSNHHCHCMVYSCYGNHGSDSCHLGTSCTCMKVACNYQGYKELTLQNFACEKLTIMPNNI